MIILIENISLKQDKYLLTFKKGKELWLTEKKLFNILKQLFPNNEIIHDKMFSLNHKFRPDYRIDDKKLCIEFQGHQHYTNSFHVYKDQIKKEIMESYGYNLIEIPYFVQLTNNITQFLFQDLVDDLNYLKDYSDGFPHGFIHPNAQLPGEFSKFGNKRVLELLKKFPKEVFEDCIKSIKIRSKYLKVPEIYLSFDMT
tara:strand:+ start:516 stop:1109 length:594 start_codon:yes stop_codon:yes gene_type:complete